MPDARPDQATGLRELFERRPGLTVLPLASVRRGMGLATVAANIAAASARNGQRTIVLDGAGGSILRALGVRAGHDLSSVLRGECDWRDVAVEVRGSVYIVDAERALAGLANGALAAIELADLYAGFRRGEPALDLAIIAGPAPRIAAITPPHEEIVVVTNPDGAALRATYAELKRAHAEEGHTAFRVIVNRANDAAHGVAAFRRLADTTRKFVGIEIAHGGTLTRDRAFVAADRKQASIFDIASASAAAGQVTQIVRGMRAWRLGRHAESQ